MSLIFRQFHIGKQEMNLLVETYYFKLCNLAQHFKFINTIIMSPELRKVHIGKQKFSSLVKTGCIKFCNWIQVLNNMSILLSGITFVGHKYPCLLILEMKGK